MITQDLLDALWDFDDPVGSEERFAIAAADARYTSAERSELATQRARALGLQQRFDEAHEVLDGLGTGSDPAVEIRIALERGRLFNSAGQPAQASAAFRNALALAHASGQRFLELDALHMLAIVDRARSDEWTQRAIELAEITADARTKRWLVSLHNNRGWSRFDAGELEAALESFRASACWAAELGTAQQRTWAAEAIAECEAAIAARDAGRPAAAAEGE
ncbi:hypothetical protein GCM10022286_14480 [Gryllotalpicola daejeonensis]|uniref:Tetratricopeptide repeat protein n=1 Tax=Gryllotalpicola daejeonensis TaxID=993087 RepID=A0ABP7ZJ47_9MICO